ncbi:zinc transporter ZIP1-like isoform X1 [Chrysoperla carnea]|uniref:zinc transporter ZIP1-like isoform X1 n=1 Tax=Chrysoperla carnea TaxID=189513 RepID=UPI001D05E050|nr:zinc transporter ZIP1-like isoform X1 [Chrysoperla carnea]
MEVTSSNINFVYNDTQSTFFTANQTYTDENHGVLVAKIIAMTVLGLSSFTVGIFPVRLEKYFDLSHTRNPHKNNLLISLMLCFGGGVLLFTTFLHLQPEVRESFAKLEKQQKIPTFGTGIPIAELVFCTGFFFVYLIEEVVHMCLEKRCSNENDEVLQRSISLRRCSKANNNEPQIIVQHSRPSLVTLNRPDEFTTGLNGGGNLMKSTEIIMSEKQSKHEHTHIIEDSMKNSFHGLLAVLALSFHAIFEGLAVGLETNRTKVWYLFAAIATHKLVIAFCVGVELVTSKTKFTLMVLYLGTFAIVTPIGIGIGIALSETSEARDEVVVATVLQGMAAGTLLYVVFFEVLARERSNDHEGIWQLMAIILGFTVMFLLQFMTGHEHSHSHGDADHIINATNLTSSEHMAHPHQ